MALADTLEPLMILWLDRSLFMQEGGNRVSWKGLGGPSPGFAGTQSLLRPCGSTHSMTGPVALKAEESNGWGAGPLDRQGSVNGAGGERGRPWLFCLCLHQTSSCGLPGCAYQKKWGQTFVLSLHWVGKLLKAFTCITYQKHRTKLCTSDIWSIVKSGGNEHLYWHRLVLTMRLSGKTHREPNKLMTFGGSERTEIGGNRDGWQWVLSLCTF